MYYQAILRVLLLASLFLAVPMVSAQNFNCPQLVLQETHNCVVGSCQGTYGIYACDTNHYTSSFQCVGGLHPTCCSKPQVGYTTAAEQGDCPSCPGGRLRPLLRDDVFFEASAGSAKKSKKMAGNTQSPPVKPTAKETSGKQAH